MNILFIMDKKILVICVPNCKITRNIDGRLDILITCASV